MQIIRHIIVLLLVASPAFAGDPEGKPAADERNPFQTSYKSLRQPALPAIEPPKIFRGVERSADDQRLLEQGYDILGYSKFEAGDVLPEQAVAQAEALKADLVLVYTSRAGGVPASVKLEAARARARQAKGENAAEPAARPQKDVVYYAYQATYWTRLPPPVLGLHVRDSKDEEAVEQGVIVMAVINDSPAEEGGLLAGDTLVALGQTQIRTAENLLQAAQRYAGKAVEVVWQRGGETLRQTVKLNDKPKN